MERGLIEVIDSGKLEETSCHCHQLIKRTYMRLIGPREPVSE
jgi:hypothetical protein